MLKMKTL